MVRLSLVDQIKRQVWLRAGVVCDANGYVSRVADNLLSGIRMDHFETDLRNGGGHELDRKVLALHSSSALAINTFAPFKDAPGMLTLLGKTGFRKPMFEKQLPTGLRGTQPNLDVYLQSDEEVVAIESKFLEYFTPKVAHYSNSYRRARFPMVEDCWWQVLEDSKVAGPRHLDVAQLVKHYLGLLHCFHGTQKQTLKKVMLLYLYWEPKNASALQPCLAHRREIDDLRIRVASSSVHFISLSYRDLWRSWMSLPRLTQHASNLIGRYLITVDMPSQLTGPEQS